jgi:hypothetical protein
MKQCTYCGKEYPDEVSVCVIDGEPVRDVRIDRAFRRLCPHCGKPVQFWSLLGLGIWRPYKCPKCHGYAQISLASRFASYAIGILVMVVGAIIYNMSDIHSSPARFIAIAATVIVILPLKMLFLATAGNFRGLPRKWDT